MDPNDPFADLVDTPPEPDPVAAPAPTSTAVAEPAPAAAADPFADLVPRTSNRDRQRVQRGAANSDFNERYLDDVGAGVREGLPLGLGRNAITRNALVGMAQAGGDLSGLASRVGSAVFNGDGSTADAIKHETDVFGDLADAADRGNTTPDIIAHGVRGASRSLTSIAMAGPIGVPGIIAEQAAIRGNQALTEASDAGVTGNARLGYAGRAAAIEGVITGIFSRFGMGGLESRMAGHETLDAGVKAGLKAAGKDTIDELPEEVLIQVLDNVNQKVSNVDPNALTPESLQAAIADTVVQTIMTVGAASSPGVVRSAMRSPQEIPNAPALDQPRLPNRPIPQPVAGPQRPGPAVVPAAQPLPAPPAAPVQPDLERGVQPAIPDAAPIAAVAPPVAPPAPAAPQPEPAAQPAATAAPVAPAIEPAAAASPEVKRPEISDVDAGDSFTRGDQVDVLVNRKVIRGQIEKVDAAGRLRIKTADGRMLPAVPPHRAVKVVDDRNTSAAALQAPVTKPTTEVSPATSSEPKTVDAEISPTNKSRPMVQTPKGPRRVTVSTAATDDGGARITRIKLHDDKTGMYETHVAPDNRFPSFDDAEAAGHQIVQQRYAQKRIEKAAAPPAAVDHVAAAAADVNTAPTEAQKEAGNYQKGHVRVNGFDVSIENPKGSERTGTDANGKPWSVTMPAHYGYIKRTEGADGEHVDVYLGPKKSARQVFVVDQVDHKAGSFDEHKVMMGYDTQEEATKAYDAAFSDGNGPARRGAVTRMSIPAFKHWVNSPRAKQPLRWKPGQQPEHRSDTGYSQVTPENDPAPDIPPERVAEDHGAAAAPAYTAGNEVPGEKGTAGAPESDRGSARVSARRGNDEGQQQISFEDLPKDERQAARGETSPKNDPRLVDLLDHGLPTRVENGETLSALALDYVEDRTPNFKVAGTKVATAQDAAAMFALLRSPFVERLSWLVTNADNMVVDSGIHSVGELASTSAPHAGNDYRQILAAARKAGSGATVWISHNHPSGDPTPSQADHLVYKTSAAYLKSYDIRFQGIVTDGDRFAHMDADGNASIQRYENDQARPYEALPFESKKFKVADATQAANFSRRVQRSPMTVVGVFADSQLRVTAVKVYPSAPNGRDVADDVRATSASSVVLTTEDADVMHEMRSRGFGKDYPAEVMDVVHVSDDNYKSLRAHGEYSPQKAGAPVKEDAPVYDAGEKKPPRPPGEDLETTDAGDERPFSSHDLTAKGLAANAFAPLVTAKALVKKGLDLWSRPLVERVEASGGPAGKAIAAKARQANDEARRLMGDLAADRAKALRAAAGFSKDSRAGVRSLRTVDWHDDGKGAAWGFARMQQAVEGDVEATAAEKPIVDGYRNLIERTGKMAEDANMQIRNADGSFRPFQASDGGKRMLRTMTAEAYDLMADQNTPQFKLLARAIAEANGIQTTKAIEALDALADRGLSKPAALEQARTLPHFPTHLRIGGRIIPILNAEPFAAIESVARNMPLRVGYVKAFGQGNAEEVLKEYARRGGELEVAKDLLRALNAMPVAQPGLGPKHGTVEETGWRYIKSAMSLLKTGLLTNSWVPNLFEPLGKTRALAGTSRFARAYAAMAAHPQDLATETARQGARTVELINWMSSPGRKIEHLTRLASEIGLILPRSVNELNEYHAAVAGLIMAKDLKAGHGTMFDRIRLEVMAFRPKQIDDIMSGKADERLYQAVVNRMAEVTQGSTSLASERSSAANSSWYRHVVAFDSFAQMTMNRTSRVNDALAKALKSGDAKRMTAAVTVAADYYFGAGISGMGAVMMKALIAGGAGGLGIALAGALDEPWEFIKGSLLYTLLGGPAEAVHQLAAGRERDAWYAPLAEVSLPISLMQDLWQLHHGQGRYKDQTPLDRAQTFLTSHLPITGPLATAMAVFGLSDKDPELQASISAYWKWRENHAPIKRAEGGQTSVQHAQFRVHMRHAMDDLKHHRDPQKNLELAAGVDTKDTSSVAKSLRGKRLLITGKDFTTEQRDQLRKHLGEHAYHRLEAMDSILNEWAARIDQPPKGPPSKVRRKR